MGPHSASLDTGFQCKEQEDGLKNKQKILTTEQECNTSNAMLLMINAAYGFHRQFISITHYLMVSHADLRAQDVVHNVTVSIVSL